LPQYGLISFHIYMLVQSPLFFLLVSYYCKLYTTVNYIIIIIMHAYITKLNIFRKQLVVVIKNIVDSSLFIKMNL